MIYACLFFQFVAWTTTRLKSFMVTEKTRSLFVVYRFYVACNTVNFTLKMFAKLFTISIHLEELRSSLNLKLTVKVKRLH